MDKFQLFAQLCESVLLTEASTLTSLMSGPAGDMLLKELHRKYALPHEAKYHEVGKLSWTDIKTNNAWVIFECAEGYAALKTVNNGDYTLLAVSNRAENIAKANESHGGRALEWIKEHVGGTRKIFMSYSKTTANVKATRKGTVTPGGVGALTVEDLLRKFRPLFNRIITHTIKDVQGMVGMQLKAGNYGAVKKRVDLLIKLEGLLGKVDDGAPLEDTDLKHQVIAALHLATAHAYPEEAGEVSASRNYYGRLEVSFSNNNPGVLSRKLLQDIAQGDTQKLSSVLSYFKQALLYL